MSGKNVVYKYDEATDGTHPQVLLVGGYGSNTLTGGTMEFGNFIPAARIDQAKSHFGDISGFDAAGQALIIARIDAAILPASPAGIIGATMTASHGGLMFGGSGYNNSFIATGPGNYEMIGGPWVDSFRISTSFDGMPATYAIDGGPGGQNNLFVTVPTGDHATVENATVADKYDPSFKALAVRTSAGVAVTAHGITNVHLIALEGSHIQYGDTSELAATFSMEGSAEVAFGGTAASDTFDVTSSYDFYGRKDLRYVRQLFDASINVDSNDPSQIATYLQNGLLVELPPGPASRDAHGAVNVFYNVIDRLNGPIYTIVRTFGTNGRTQTIQYRLLNADASSIILDGGGSSDTYNITQGLGSFVDIQVNDSDTTTQNILNVQFRNPLLLPDQAILRDNTIELDYYTPITSFRLEIYNGLFLDTGHTHFYSTSVAYSPRVFFGGNVDVAFRTGRPFKNTIVDRPAPELRQHASLVVDGILDTFVPPGVLGWATDYGTDPYPPNSLFYLRYHATGFDLPVYDLRRDYFIADIFTAAYDTLHPEQGVAALNAQFVSRP